MIQNTFNFAQFAIGPQVRENLALMMKPYSRAWVAEELSKLVQHEISESTLNNYTAPSQNGNRSLPFELAPGICQVTKSTLLWELGSKPINALLSKTRLEEIARQDEIIRRATVKKAELEGRI